MDGEAAVAAEAGRSRAWGGAAAAAPGGREEDGGDGGEEDDDDGDLASFQPGEWVRQRSNGLPKPAKSMGADTAAMLAQELDELQKERLAARQGGEQAQAAWRGRS